MPSRAHRLPHSHSQCTLTEQAHNLGCRYSHLKLLRSLIKLEQLSQPACPRPSPTSGLEDHEARSGKWNIREPGVRLPVGLL